MLFSSFRKMPGVAELLMRAASPSIGETYLSANHEWVAHSIRTMQATLYGPEIAVAIAANSGFLSIFVGYGSWLNLSRADINQGAALYLIFFYIFAIFVGLLCIMWTILVVSQSTSRYVAMMQAAAIPSRDMWSHVRSFCTLNFENVFRKSVSCRQLLDTFRGRVNYHNSAAHDAKAT
jgi:hypothetical protein